MDYPQLFIPEKIKKALLNEYLKPLPPIEPNHPIPPNSNFLFKALVLILGILMLCFKFTFFIGIVIIGFFIYYVTTNDERNIYDREMLFYRSKLNEYHNNLKTYKIELEIFKNNSKDFYQNYKIRTNLVLALKSSSTHFINIDYKKGITHDFFKTYLLNYFGSFVVESISINKPKYLSLNEEYNLYITDFGYINTEKNIHIAIEIDEPYTIKEKKPIHFKNDERNDFFINNNWIVIRFAEEQIALYPNLCCDFIKHVIDCIDEASINLITPITKLPKIPKFTINNINEMIVNNHRNNYLKEIGCNKYEIEVLIEDMFGFKADRLR